MHVTDYSLGSMVQSMPTAVLASSTATLIAVDVPLPVEMTALVMVGLVLRWLIRKENHTDTLDEQRLTRLERRITDLESDASEQRHLKHAALNQLAGLRGMVKVMKTAALRCSCDAMIPVLPLIEIFEEHA